MSHSRIVPSSLPLARVRPSGENDTDMKKCPVSKATSAFVRESYSQIPMLLGNAARSVAVTAGACLPWRGGSPPAVIPLDRPQNAGKWELNHKFLILLRKSGIHYSRDLALQANSTVLRFETLFKSPFLLCGQPCRTAKCNTEKTALRPQEKL